ncbi:Uncharacterised protein [Mycobacterium tuberculosis]|nr:Uncharacterised protein [Mycobacterium tuberculosis]CNW15745.1 Uncharacterised protein [Mycobacterium tuberculosis]
MPQVLAHQGDVGGFDGDVGSHGAHRDSQVGGGQGRSVVDSVADHRGGLPSPQLCDQMSLVLGPQFGMYLLDAGLGCQGGSGGMVVAGEHRHLVAAGAQPGHHLGGFRA